MGETTDSMRTERRTRSADLAWDHPDQDRPIVAKRDWMRLLLVLGLGILSWVATFVGMLELIEANMGELPIVHKLIIGFSVAMLMAMVVWLLDQMFTDIGWMRRLLFVSGYIFLTAISVGFGFGFYWKVLESRGESSRSAESAVGQVQNALHGAATRLEQLQGTLDSLTTVSAEKAALERANGTSCIGSRPGDGPRRQMRDDDAGRFKFAADFVRGRVGAIKTELGGLTGDMAKVMGTDKSTVDAGSGTRNEFMRNLNRRLDMTVTGFNAFRSDPQLRQIRSDLAERADKVSFLDSKGGTYQCPDAQLTTALKGVVRAIDELPTVEKPKIAAVEGSEAVIEAFRRLTATLVGALSFKLPPSPEELRELQKKAVQSVDNSAQTQARLNAMSEQAGLSKRDYIPLAIALFVDICLLLVSIKAPGSALERLVPKMRAAERGPVIQILSRFNEIHKDPEIRENFEVFRHVVFDFHGDYYAAVPMNTPYRPNPRNGQQSQGYGVSDAEELMQEAHLLANLFASFEKEKIFTRVYSPLLSTGTVQKRLRRQGSKFANAGAFRVYRFRDGAWSDIILGAVMGAARRVENGERRRRVEEDVFRDAVQPAALAPLPGLPGHGNRPQEAPRTAAGPSHFRPGGAGPSLDDVGADRSRSPGYAATPRAPFMPHVVGAGQAQSGPARRPANSNTWPHARAPHETRPTAETAAQGFEQSGALMPENVVMHPSTAGGRGGTGASIDRDAMSLHGMLPPQGPRPQAFDPGATSAFAGGAAAMAAVQPNEAPISAVAAPVAAPPVAAPPVATPAEPTVTVAATRETVTYTLPVSEARLPPSLLARAQSKTQVATATAPMPGDATYVVSAAPAKALPPPLRPAASVIEADVIALPASSSSPMVAAKPVVEHSAPVIQSAAGDTIGEDVRSMALRFGPATREG